MSNRWNGAQCATRLDLPWTSDTTPTDTQIDQMTSVCESCPILTQCAMYALRNAAGGFYAGIWLPWDKTTSTTLRDNRRRARQVLRRKVAVSV